MPLNTALQPKKPLCFLAGAVFPGAFVIAFILAVFLFAEQAARFLLLLLRLGLGRLYLHRYFLCHNIIGLGYGYMQVFIVEAVSNLRDIPAYFGKPSVYRGGIRFVLISPPELRVPDYIIEDTLNAKGIEYKEVENLDEAMPELDILYMTRVQRERFFNEEDYIRMKDCYILDKKKMELARDDMFVLHPLPRVNEISVEVDNDPRAAYFKQVQYGVYVRMALIMTLLEVEKPC